MLNHKNKDRKSTSVRVSDRTTRGRKSTEILHSKTLPLMLNNEADLVIRVKDYLISR